MVNLRFMANTTWRTAQAIREMKKAARMARSDQ
jgi:hypothetical protein